ncbi:MAG: hypothetical protein Q8Q25_03375, partial [bacterium]|nr:hypothetical protein [bacterium]
PENEQQDERQVQIIKEYFAQSEKPIKVLVEVPKERLGRITILRELIPYLQSTKPKNISWKNIETRQVASAAIFMFGIFPPPHAFDSEYCIDYATIEGNEVPFRFLTFRHLKEEFERQFSFLNHVKQEYTAHEQGRLYSRPGEQTVEAIFDESLDHFQEERDALLKSLTHYGIKEEDTIVRKAIELWDSDDDKSRKILFNKVMDPAVRLFDLHAFHDILSTKEDVILAAGDWHVTSIYTMLMQAGYQYRSIKRDPQGKVLSEKEFYQFFNPQLRLIPSLLLKICSGLRNSCTIL